MSIIENHMLVPSRAGGTTWAAMGRLVDVQECMVESMRIIENFMLVPSRAAGSCAALLRIGKSPICFACLAYWR